MMNNWKKNTIKEARQLFKAEESRFMLFTGLKVSGISLCISLGTYYALFLAMRLNYAFFKANGFPDLVEDNLFYDYLLGEAVNSIPVLFLFHVFLFFIGYYVGWLMLRPFRAIGEYCESALEDTNAIYKVEDFSTYRLLTRFSEFFFEYVRESRKRGEIITNSIPPQYSRIHKPVLDRIFLLHFGLLLVIIGICSSVFIIENSSSVFASMIELATKTLPTNTMVQKFFSEQMFIFDELVTFSIILNTFFYLLLGLHLYEKVSGAAFGIFSTMRSFMKGNYFSRVHLVGYPYIREYTRRLNKYLEFVQINLAKEKPKG